jgi:hypothetical protein
MTLLFPVMCFCQDDAATYLKVEKARSEVPTCRKLLENSKALGSIPMMFLNYSDLDKRTIQLTHCGFAFRITGDLQRADEAGNESDRYDAAASRQMKRYIESKNLWNDFVKQDCREGSAECGKK